MKAFPIKDVDHGMDLRDYFAAHAMQGLLAGLWVSHQRQVAPHKGNKMLATDAYSLAEHMMKARAQ